MAGYKVVEKENHNVVHCVTWSEKRASEWVIKYGNSKMFMNKTLNSDSFEVIKD